LIEYRDVVAHINCPELHYHDSVQTPEIVPLVMEFNDSHVIGRAGLRRDLDNNIVADLFVSDNPEIEDLLPQPPAAPNIFVSTKESDLMEFEGTNYVMQGSVTGVTISLVKPVEAAEKVEI
jgi:hypothetical protein